MRSGFDRLEVLEGVEVEADDLSGDGEGADVEDAVPDGAAGVARGAIRIGDGSFGAHFTFPCADPRDHAGIIVGQNEDALAMILVADRHARAGDGGLSHRVNGEVVRSRRAFDGAHLVDRREHVKEVGISVAVEEAARHETGTRRGTGNFDFE